MPAMQIQTHYTTLGLVPTAPTPVIRAAYKALVLLNHPDKTIHLPASERACHSAIFRSIQEAFDVLGNASLKASYDAELTRHHGTVNVQSSTFHHKINTENHSMYTSGSFPIHLTTAEEKAAMKAKTEAALIELRSQQRTRNSEEAKLGLADLKFMLKIWKDLAHENRSDAIMFAHCTIMIHEYDAKVAQKEFEHDDWVKSMATPKHTPRAPKTKISTPEPEQYDRFASAPGAPRKKTHNPLYSPFFPSSPNVSYFFDGIGANTSFASRGKNLTA
jgi:DNA mismatch repair ATPase MutL